MMVAISAHIASIAVAILPTVFGYDWVWCGHDTQFVGTVTITSDDFDKKDFDFDVSNLNAKSSLCSFQAFVLIYGFLSATFWWCIVAANLFLELYLSKFLKNRSVFLIFRKIVYHVVAWGVSFILSIIPVAASKMGLAPGETLYVLISNSIPIILILFNNYIVVI